LSGRHDEADRSSRGQARRQRGRAFSAGRQRPRRPRDRHGRGRPAMTASLKDQAAIAGIGATEFSKESGRSELQLAVEAVRAALDDAGLAPSEVDGMVTVTMETNPEIEVARNLGIPALRLLGRVHYGGRAAS